MNEWEMQIQEDANGQQSAVLDAARRDQQSINDEANQLLAAERQQRAQQAIKLQNWLAVGIRNSSNGVLPEVLRSRINREFGWDGVESGILAGSGVQKDGSYRFNIGNGKDPLGQVAVQGMTFDMPRLYQMMHMNRAVFGDGDRSAMRGLLLKRGLSEKEVAGLEFDPFAGAVERSVQGDVDFADPEKMRQRISRPSADPESLRNRVSANGGEAGGRLVGGTTPFKRGGQRHSRISVFASDGRGGITKSRYDGFTGESEEENLGTRDPKYQGRWNVIESNADGKRYVNDKTGDEVFVKNGETPPWVRFGVGTGRDGLTFDERRKLEAQKQQGKIDLANLTGEQKKEVEAARNALRKYGYDIAAAGKSGAQKFDKDMYKALQEQLTSLEYDEDENGVKTKRTLSEDEQKMAQRIRSKMQSMTLGEEEEQPEQQPAPEGGKGGSGTGSPTITPEQAKAELARRKAAAAGNPAPEVKPGEKKPVAGKETAKTDSEKIHEEWLRRQGRKPGENEEAKPPEFYDDLDKGTLDELKRLYPEATDEEIRSGKYDNEIQRIASLSGEGKTGKKFAEHAANKEAERKKREEDYHQKRLQEYRVESGKLRKRAEDEAKRKGVSEGWPKWRIDEYAKKRWDEMHDDLVKSLGLHRKALTGEIE